VRCFPRRSSVKTWLSLTWVRQHTNTTTMLLLCLPATTELPRWFWASDGRTLVTFGALGVFCWNFLREKRRFRRTRIWSI
jgi:hypothetical protein